MKKDDLARFLTSFARSPKTIRAYSYALKQFVGVVGIRADLNTETYIKFLSAIKHLSPSTQRVYRTAVSKFYGFMKAGNRDEMEEANEHYTYREGRRIINFNREGIEKLLAYCETLRGDLLALRDRAFVFTLADTGLRIEEACTLKRGDLDWIQGTAVIIGKGNKQAVIRFSERSLEALKKYLTARSKINQNSRIPLASQPLFAAHDTHASKHILPISDDGMRKAIKGTKDGRVRGRMEEAGVSRDSVRIHDFRHYFVTMTYIAKGNLLLSQELARHEDISTTGRYAHFGGQTDAAYKEIFNKKK